MTLLCSLFKLGTVSGLLWKRTVFDSRSDLNIGKCVQVLAVKAFEPVIYLGLYFDNEYSKTN